MTRCTGRPAWSAVVVALAIFPGLRAADSPARISEGFQKHDRAIHIKDDWIRDPYIVRGQDGWFYLTGTTQMPEQSVTPETQFNVGLGATSLVGWQARMWRTRDFLTWDNLGAPYSLKDGVWFQDQPERFDAVSESHWRLWAPELHLDGSRWLLVHTSPSPVQGANLSICEGPLPKAPWSNPMGTKIAQRHDPSLFHDDDGTWWLIWGATQIAPLKPDFSDLAAAPTAIQPADHGRMGHEGCLVRKIGSKYVLFGTGWSTNTMRKGSYNLYYATANAITGPYSERRFAGRFLGHGTPFQDDHGRWWCTAFFNANAPPVPRDGSESRDLAADAQTINRQGVTLVPLDVRVLDSGDVSVRAVDPAYATPGPDEAGPVRVDVK